MSARLLGYELRLLGAAGLGTPVLVLLLFGGLALLSSSLGADGVYVARLLVAALELGLPLAAGVAAASVASDDPAIDLQLSLETRYRVTLGRRLALLVLWTSLLALPWTLALRLSGLWSLWVPETVLVGQLVWLSPLLWFVGAGAALSLLTGSRTTSGAVLGGLWVFGNLFRGVFLTEGWLRPLFPFATVYAAGADFWLTNRLALIGVALALGLAAWALSSMTQLMARGGEA